jgi:excisionase family DNA binding protein
MSAKRPKPRIRLQLVDADGAEIDELLTVKQAAERLGIADSHVATLYRERKLTNYELTKRCTLVSKKDVEAIIASRDDPNRERRGRPRIGPKRK